MKLQEELRKFIDAPYDPIINFNLGICYLELDQTTSAYSYFLRTAEFTDDTNLIYESLIQSAICLGKQVHHRKSERGMLLHALSLIPTRPESYFLLSQLYERSDDWIGAYTMAELGLQIAFDVESISNLLYPGYYGLIFQKAVTSWWIGRHDESKELFTYLFNEKESIMHDSYKQLVHNNLTFLNKGQYPKLPYTRLIHNKLKVKFPSSGTIKRNYSQSYQDMFVLSMLRGKKRGTYVEIGSSDPFSGNNTALLETEFEWSGISFDILESEVNKFKEQRKNPVFLADATKVDYSKVFKENNLGNEIDYLQLDCDPPSVTYEILTKIPFDEYKFGVITYEHDYYADETKTFRNKSRQYLLSKGYKLMVTNVAPNDTDAYEDWWVHPDLVNMDNLQNLKNIDHSTKNVENLMLFT